MLGYIFYHTRFLPGLALLILRHVLRINELACLTRISVDLLEARFLYSYLRMSGVDLCSSTMALTSIVWLPLSWLAWFVMSVACFSVSSLSFLSSALVKPSSALTFIVVTESQVWALSG